MKEKFKEELKQNDILVEREKRNKDDMTLEEKKKDYENQVKEFAEFISKRKIRVVKNDE